MSSESESDTKPVIQKKAKTTPKKRKQDDDDEEDDFKPDKTRKWITKNSSATCATAECHFRLLHSRVRPSKDSKAPTKRPATRTDAPAFTPETCDPPITNARDPRLTVAILERCIDEMSPDLRKEMAKKFGVDPNKMSIAWGDTIKFKVKRDIRQVMLGNGGGN